MTLVECFEQSPLENIASFLNLRPDKLIFVGSASDMQDSYPRYCEIVKKKNSNTQVDKREIDGLDSNGIAQILEDIVKSGDECVFDLGGGDGVVLTAAGMAYNSLRDQYPISMQRVNILTGTPQDCDGDGLTKDPFEPTLTVKNLIFLYGGVVAPDTPQPPRDFSPLDIAPLWDAVTKDSSSWNKCAAALTEFEKRAGAKGECLEVRINFRALREKVKDYALKRARFDSIIEDLRRGGVISIKDRSETNFCYRYKSPVYRRCIKKAGNTLEYKTFLEARAFFEGDQPYFTNCVLGVNIDWDGIVHHGAPGGVKDTKNEIDVMLMHGLTPVFVSCKNGAIKEIERYKLNTVAERFGGEFAQKLLVSTDFDPENEDTRKAFLQRAADMNIVFEPDAASLDSAGWQQLFKKTVEGKAE